jgi:DNA-binding transcriptional LysR family regulator
MELRQIRYFVYVAQEKQFVKASKKLFVSQSALSQQIKLLETELGVELFDQQKRKIARTVELTEAGKIFLKDAKKILELESKILKNLSLLKPDKKKLSLGTYRMLHGQRIIDSIKIISQRYAHYEIELKEFENYLDVQKAVDVGEIDFGITVKPVKHKGLNFHDLMKSELQILIYEKHPLSKSSALKLEDLKAENWVEIKQEFHPIYEQIEAFCTAAGFNREPLIVQEVPSLELLCHFVSLGKGLAFVPSFFDVSAIPNVFKKKIENITLEFQQCIVFKKNYSI